MLKLPEIGRNNIKAQIPQVEVFKTVKSAQDLESSIVGNSALPLIEAEAEALLIEEVGDDKDCDASLSDPEASDSNLPDDEASFEISKKLTKNVLPSVLLVEKDQTNILMVMTILAE